MVKLSAVNRMIIVQFYYTSPNRTDKGYDFISYP